MNSIHRTLLKLAALSLLATSTTALAGRPNDGFLRRKDFDKEEQAREDRGLALGLRAGYGVPFGEFGENNNRDGGKLKDLYSGAIPLQVDVGYFFNSHLYLGASFQYGLVQLAEDCPDGASCSASQMRFGVNLAYHFKVGKQLEPWVGVGLGYEILDSSVSTEALGVTSDIGTSLRGFEFATVQGGLDYRITKMFSVGPFVTFTAGQYTTVGSSIKTEGGGPIFGDVDESDEEDIDEPAVHGWLYGGVRLQLRF
ncbi:outer membrane beta-barrel protein [Pyxidicoccus sp. 3LG]